MPPTPLKRESLVDQLHARLVDLIQNGRLAPGGRLKIEELAAEFGVSRTPVREAISKLTQEGFVVQRHNSGPRVADFDRWQIAEIIETNRVLFDGVMDCLRRLADETRDELAGRLTSTLDEQETALKTGHVGRFHTCSVAFHRLLIEFCPNRILRELALQSQYKLNLCALFHQSQTLAREASLTEHREILAALRERDFDRAARLMQVHNRQALAHYLARASEWPGAEE